MIRHTCPCCGRLGRVDQFGMAPDGAVTLPHWDLQTVAQSGLGRGRGFAVQREAMGTHTAMQLRSALKQALARLEAEIVEATGNPLED